MADVTQETVDALVLEAQLACPAPKRAELDADIKAQAHMPFATQARFLEGVIRTFESVKLEKYLPDAIRNSNSDGTRKKPAKTNPWSKEGWNVSAQGKLVLSMGEAKAAQIAEAAGCKIGSTKWNADYV
jgi:hypothetical protein